MIKVCLLVFAILFLYFLIYIKYLWFHLTHINTMDIHHKIRRIVFNIIIIIIIIIVIIIIIIIIIIVIIIATTSSSSLLLSSSSSLLLLQLLSLLSLWNTTRILLKHEMDWHHFSINASGVDAFSALHSYLYFINYPWAFPVGLAPKVWLRRLSDDINDHWHA